MGERIFVVISGKVLQIDCCIILKKENMNEHGVSSKKFCFVVIMPYLETKRFHNMEQHPKELSGDRFLKINV